MKNPLHKKGQMRRPKPQFRQHKLLCDNWYGYLVLIGYLVYMFTVCGGR